MSAGSDACLSWCTSSFSSMVCCFLAPADTGLSLEYRVGGEMAAWAESGDPVGGVFPMMGEERVVGGGDMEPGDRVPGSWGDRGEVGDSAGDVVGEAVGGDIGRGEKECDLLYGLLKRAGVDLEFSFFPMPLPPRGSRLGMGGGSFFVFALLF